MDGKTQKENSQERESPILGEYLNINNKQAVLPNGRNRKKEVVGVSVPSVRKLQPKNFLQLNPFDVVCNARL